MRVEEDCLRIAASWGWMAEARLVMMLVGVVELFSFSGSAIAAALGVGADRTVRKVLAIARTEIKDFMLRRVDGL